MYFWQQVLVILVEVYALCIENKWAYVTVDIMDYLSVLGLDGRPTHTNSHSDFLFLNGEKGILAHSDFIETYFVYIISTQYKYIKKEKKTLREPHAGSSPRSHRPAPQI